MSDAEKTGSAIAPNVSDYVTSGIKSVVGAAPFVGSLLVEIAGSIIPNQRIARIARFAIELEARLAGLEQDVLRTQLADENFTDLMEESIRQAARSTSDERRTYIASLVANGIADETVKFTETKHLLRMLGELNDAEVIWLNYHGPHLVGGGREMREKYANVLKLSGTTDSTTVSESYHNHLTTLGLLYPTFKRDHTNYPIFNSYTGGQEMEGHNITKQGVLLLRFIGLYERPQ